MTKKEEVIQPFVELRNKDKLTKDSKQHKKNIQTQGTQKGTADNVGLSAKKTVSDKNGMNSLEDKIIITT